MADRIIKNKTFQCIYFPLLLILACLINYFEIEIYGAAFFALITAAMLIYSSRLTDAMLPALLIMVFVTRLYNVFNNFWHPEWKEQIIHILWVAVPVVFSVIFHFIYYRKPFVIGRSFFGICAISAALILGGLGTITAEDYFAPTALFYTFALGLGMVIFYLLIRPHIDGDFGREVAKIMYVVGIFACFCVLMGYVRNWEWVLSNKQFLPGKVSLEWGGICEGFQSQNNISTFLMLAMPFPIYFATKNPVHILSVALMYACTVMSGSRGGLVMGTAELGILLLCYVVVYPKNLKQRVIAISSSAIIGIGVILCIPVIVKYCGVSGQDGQAIFNFKELFFKLKDSLIDRDEARFQLLDRMKADFKNNPIFGMGIGYTGNENIYSPVEGAMNWYHMWFAQVIGGLGICGILAYGYQLVDRVIIFFKNRSNLTLTLLLSYVGLFLMSQVNPGEFCPAPYAMLAVTFFAIMEIPQNDCDTSNVKLNKKA